MKCMKRIAALLLSAWLICALSAAAYAHDVPDMNRKGTITVDMVYDGKAVTGGSLTAYRVGRIQEDNGSYRFVKTDAMKELKDDYDDIGSPKLAKNVAAFVRANGVAAYMTAENTGGKAVFNDVEPGLYLIEQTLASDGYEPINPFLITIPMNENGQYKYTVTAEGKFQLTQLPTPTPTPSDRPTPPPRPTPPWHFRTKLPQTGQLNWPIPVLTLVGLGIFTTGWVLRYGKKKEEHEK